jgi:DNA-binding transcriptional regulator of glucitol operon
MLLLGLCGVDEEIISREYALSNLGYWGKWMPASDSVCSFSYALFQIEPEEELVKKANMLGTSVENMRMVMSAP